MLYEQSSLSSGLTVQSNRAKKTTTTQELWKSVWEEFKEGFLEEAKTKQDMRMSRSWSGKWGGRTKERYSRP